MERGTSNVRAHVKRAYQHVHTHIVLNVNNSMRNYTFAGAESHRGGGVASQRKRLGWLLLRCEQITSSANVLRFFLFRTLKYVCTFVRNSQLNRIFVSSSFFVMTGMECSAEAVQGYHKACLCHTTRLISNPQQLTLLNLILSVGEEIVVA